MDELLTLREAADRLGITPDTLRQQIRVGTLPATKKGIMWFVTAAHVEHYRVLHLDKRNYSRRRQKPGGDKDDRP